MKRKLTAIALSIAVAATFTVLGAEPVPAPTPTTTPTTTTTPAAGAEPSTAPATDRGGGGRGVPTVVIAPLASAETVELAPPLERSGNFKHAPKTSWRDVPGIVVKEGTPMPWSRRN
jgi:hypothetical protein